MSEESDRLNFRENQDLASVPSRVAHPAAGVRHAAANTDLLPSAEPRLAERVRNARARLQPTRFSRERQSTHASKPIEPGVTPRSIAVVGTGYVGLTLSACLASLGHRVHATDCSIERVARLTRGDVPIVEEGLSALTIDALASGRLCFGIDNVVAVSNAEFVFLCVPTPEGADGQADLSFVLDVAREIGPYLRPGTCVITKSTVPVGTSALLETTLGRDDVHVVSNPEFLAEGTAVRDCLEPDRIVVGARNLVIAESVALLYGPKAASRTLITDLASAELVKYASNAYLATRLTFVNSIAELCEAAGADVRAVARGMGSDRRIGSAFLQPGPGWGGSCLPKDTIALVRTADALNCDLALVRTAIKQNGGHIRRMVQKAVTALDEDAASKRVGVWGMTFKPGTDDLRCSPALEIARSLVALGAQVSAFDPTLPPGELFGIEAQATPYAACEEADLLIIATEWPEFVDVNLDEVSRVMRRQVVFDTRNVLAREIVEEHGFTYFGVGVPSPTKLEKFVGAVA
jgi:UDPglucose 6-dehydrogenase